MINTEQEKKTKTTVIMKEEKGNKGVELKNEEEMPNLNRLATIQEQVREEEEFNSFRVVPHEDDPEEYP